MRDAGKNWKVKRPLVSCVSFYDLSVDTWCSYVAYPSTVQASTKLKNWNETSGEPLSVQNIRGEDPLLIRLRAGLR